MDSSSNNNEDKEHKDLALNQTQTNVRIQANPNSPWIVFCDECKTVNNGKIRYLCKVCKEEAFVLSSEPKNWNELLNTQIRGECALCHSTQGTWYAKCSNHSTKRRAIPLCQLFCSSYQLCKYPKCMQQSNLFVHFGCQHLTCIDCWKQYANDRIDSKQCVFDTNVGYTLRCPEQCNNSRIMEPHMFKIVGTLQYDKFKSFSLSAYVDASNHLHCPACSSPILVSSRGNLALKIPCPYCKQEFCRECRRNHAGTCSKQCPQCKASVNKPSNVNGPCTCGNCGFQLCWLCKEEWNGGSCHIRQLQ